MCCSFCGLSNNTSMFQFSQWISHELQCSWIHFGFINLFSHQGRQVGELMYYRCLVLIFVFFWALDGLSTFLIGPVILKYSFTSSLLFHLFSFGIHDVLLKGTDISSETFLIFNLELSKLYITKIKLCLGA